MIGFARVAALAAGLLLGCVLAGAPSVAGAAPPRQAIDDATSAAEAKGMEARGAYRAGHYERAIALYFEANDLAASAGFLFNVAFIYERKLRDPELALQYYHRVIAFPGADATVVDKARQRAEALEAARGRAEAPREAALAADKVEVDGGGNHDIGSTHAEVHIVGARAVERRAVGGEKQGRGVVGASTVVVRPPEAPSRLAPWFIFGTGVVALGVGAAFGVTASGTEADFLAATDPELRQRLRARGRDEALMADVIMAGGFVVTSVGLVLLLSEGGDERSARVTPALVGGGGLGLALGGTL